MRTTVNLSPEFLATMKAIALRDQKTLGEAIEAIATEGLKAKQLTFRANGMPQVRKKVKGLTITTEDVKGWEAGVVI